MRPKIRQILEECIERGIENGFETAHEYNDEPMKHQIFGEIEDSIWLEIDQRFVFGNEPDEDYYPRGVCTEVVEGFDHLEKERQWVELSDEDQDQIFEQWHAENKGSRDLCYMVEAKLKELNA